MENSVAPQSTGGKSVADQMRNFGFLLFVFEAVLTAMDATTKGKSKKGGAVNPAADPMVGVPGSAG